MPKTIIGVQAMFSQTHLSNNLFDNDFKKNTFLTFLTCVKKIHHINFLAAKYFS